MSGWAWLVAGLAVVAVVFTTSVGVFVVRQRRRVDEFIARMLDSSGPPPVRRRVRR